MRLGPSQLSVYNDCNLQKTQIASYYPPVVALGARLRRMQIYGIPDRHRRTGQGLYQWQRRAETLKSLKPSPAQPARYTPLESFPQTPSRKGIPTKPLRSQNPIGGGFYQASSPTADHSPQKVFCHFQEQPWVAQEKNRKGIRCKNKAMAGIRLLPQSWGENPVIAAEVFKKHALISLQK